jgi:hypothetical protein
MMALNILRGMAVMKESDCVRNDIDVSDQYKRTAQDRTAQDRKGQDRTGKKV